MYEFAIRAPAERPSSGTNKVAINIHVRIFLRTSFSFLLSVPMSGIPGSESKCRFNFVTKVC
jgi:hypothetical protein